MKTQAAKILASLLLITGLGSVTLKAQLTVKSVGSVRHGTDTQVTILFSAPVDQTTATTPGNYTFPAGITVAGASLMTGLPPANSIDIAQNPAPNGRAFDNECVVLTVTGLAPDAATSVTIQNVQDRATPPNTIAATTINFKDSGYTWAESGTPAIPGKVIANGTNGFGWWTSAWYRSTRSKISCRSRSPSSSALARTSARLCRVNCPTARIRRTEQQLTIT